MTTDEVKKELRQLSFLRHLIEAQKNRKRIHEADLERMVKDKASASEIERVENILQSIDIQASIVKASEIESKYMSAIDQLMPLERTIIIQHYINGLPYWKIGKQIGYEISRTRQLHNKAINQLTQLLK